MQLSVRLHAVAECLAGLQEDSQSSASTFLKAYFQARRYIGSHDRRAITEDVYAIMRAWCGWKAIAPSLTPRQAVWHYAGRGNALDISEDERDLVELPKNGSLEPATLQGRFTGDFWTAMAEPAPLDLRINPLKITRDQAWYRLLPHHPDITPTPWSPLGLRIPSKGTPTGLLKKMLANGILEVQDEGSQLIGLLCDAGPHTHVWDACAGAGGKTMVLGACMQNTGCLVASDGDLTRLMKAQPRLERAGLHRVQYQAWQHVHQMFDRVLVDAPCSGTGTWRRHPELAMRFTLPNTSQQFNILRDASKRVKQDGLLIYATCSILNEENEDIVQTFLDQHRHFQLEDIAPIWRGILETPCPVTTPWLHLSPLDHYSDGFFVAVMRCKIRLF